MSTKEVITEKPKGFTDKEINEMSEWLNDLSLQQLFFLKSSYEAFLAMELVHMESPHVH